jgi:hypothetical protein
MATVFREEQQLLEALLEEWYEAIGKFTDESDGIFSERGQKYDRIIPPWQSLDFPGGMAHEIGKKIDRVKQYLDGGDEHIDWAGVAEELKDITNYARMMGGVILMLEVRGEWDPELPSEPYFSSPPSQESQPGTDQDSTTDHSAASTVPTKRRRGQPIRRG